MHAIYIHIHWLPQPPQLISKYGCPLDSTGIHWKPLFWSREQTNRCSKQLTFHDHTPLVQELHRFQAVVPSATATITMSSAPAWSNKRITGKRRLQGLQAAALFPTFPRLFLPRPGDDQPSDFESFSSSSFEQQEYHFQVAPCCCTIHKWRVGVCT